MNCKRRKLLKLQTTRSLKDLQNYWRTKLFQNILVKCQKWLRIFDGNMCKILVLGEVCHWNRYRAVAFIVQSAWNDNIKLEGESLSNAGIQRMNCLWLLNHFCRSSGTGLAYICYEDQLWCYPDLKRVVFMVLWSFIWCSSVVFFSN